MSDSVHAPESTDKPPRRRPWTTPELVTHESMMVLTQQFFGVPSAPTMLLGLAQTTKLFITSKVWSLKTLGYDAYPPRPTSPAWTSLGLD